MEANRRQAIWVAVGSVLGYELLFDENARDVAELKKDRDALKREVLMLEQEVDDLRGRQSDVEDDHRKEVNRRRQEGRRVGQGP